MNFPNDSPTDKQIMAATAAASLQLVHHICNNVYWYTGERAQGPFSSHIPWGVSQP